MKIKIIVAVIFGIVGFFLILPTPEQDNAIKNGDELNTKSTSSDKHQGNNAELSVMHVNLFDGHTMHNNMNVYIADGKVLAMENNDESIKETNKWEAIKSIDGTGKTLIPGLIDAHAHTWGNALEQSLQFGVTTQMDMFTDPKWASQQRHGAKGKSLKESDLYSASNLITAPHGHGTEFGMDLPTIKSADEADQFVKDRIDEGSDYIKIVYESPKAPYKMFPSINKETLKAVVEAAHKTHKIAVVHAQNQASALDAINAGADGIEHIFMDSLATDELLQAAKNHGTFFTPTLAVFASLAPKAEKEAMVKSVLSSEKLSKVFNKSIESALHGGFPTSDKMKKLWPIVLKNVALLNQAGIPILAGSDAPNPGTTFGISLHVELQWLVKAGLTPIQALRAATSNVGKAFGIAGLGQLELGSTADMVLLGGNPLEDIQQTLNIEHIWKNGTEISLNTLSTKQKSATSEGIFADFNQGKLVTQSGSEFYPSTDQMMGGKSEVTMVWKASHYHRENHSEKADKEGYLSLQGEIKPGFMAPWSGATMPLGQSMKSIVDISKLTRIRFKARGSDPRYSLLLFSEGQMQPVSVEFKVTKNWQTVTIPLSQFTHANTEQSKFIAWSALSTASRFSLDIDDLRIE